MFHLIKLILFLLGLAVATYFVLPLFGYEVNRDYFSQSKEKCQQKITDCPKRIIEQGTKNTKCDLDCVDPSLIIKKK